MRRSIRFAVAGAVAAAGLAVAPLAVADEATELNVLSWNTCGEAGGKRGDAGFCPYRDDPQAKVDVIADLVAEHDLDVILLQEVCAETADSHLGRLKTALGDGWQIGNARGARPDGRTDCRGDLNGELGVGIAIKASNAEFTSKQTLPPDPTGQSKQTLPTLCATTTDWPTKVCTTHILADPEDPRRPQQVKNVRDYVWPSRANLVLGGDFNLFPGSATLKPISDNFHECDGRSYGSGDKVDETTHHAWTGDNTHVYRKRDHIFASKPDSGTNFGSCDSRTDLMDTTENEPDSGPPSGYSDHAPLLGTVTI